MTARILWGGLALAGALFLSGPSAPAQDKAADAKKKMEEYFAAMAKAGVPGPKHKLLEPLIGKWNFTATFWFDPSTPAMESKGTAERKWILGGRFFTDEVQADGFGPDGFRGFGLSGYDNVLEKYTGFWVDSMTTAMSMSYGTADSSGKVFTYTKEDVDPVTKQKIKGRDVVRIESNDKHVMEMYKVGADGKEFKNGVLTFTRK